MERHITAGIDGSSESLDAADWAAWEALRRGLPLHLVHAADEPASRTRLPELDAPAERERTALDHAAMRLSYGHPTLTIRPSRISGPPVPALLAAADSAETLVLGSRGYTTFAAFMVGSVALGVTAGASRPVVLVRAGERPEDEHEDTTAGPYRPVVLGLDLDHPCDEVLEYAFYAATIRRAPLHVLHTWMVPLVPSASADDPEEEKARALTAALAPWHHTFPEIQVREQLIHGRAGHHLLMASTNASLMVIGRSIAPGGEHLGITTRSVIHHVLCPVAVVPHA
ncbi:stress-inducible protein [Streptomyces lunaelactis]|uniref:Stress-inducible protein n=1 Tax=Streptomyces lunaelactis TaxID=1535768 RepID=A0A2R4SWH2_9ACTN|nr:universal stress protein [Streptomyces lunaelactis]AVZ71233.1 stress-inducible protein [Streptomyces lunaelactis]NUK88580.1 universal stress protein [Streptomyces lunaelactis]